MPRCRNIDEDDNAAWTVAGKHEFGKEMKTKERTELQRCARQTGWAGSDIRLVGRPVSLSLSLSLSLSFWPDHTTSCISSSLMAASCCAIVDGLSTIKSSHWFYIAPPMHHELYLTIYRVSLERILNREFFGSSCASQSFFFRENIETFERLVTQSCLRSWLWRDVNEMITSIFFLRSTLRQF